jgi:hypothetical protein
MRVLDSRNVTVREELRVEQCEGYERAWRGSSLLADDSNDTYARVARFAIAAAPLKGKYVAWIGGGLCVGPRLFSIADCTQTVHEIEPALAEFCPTGVTFIPGDWRDTITGKFDVIVFDIADEVPRTELAKFLNPGGVILPKG